MTSRVVFSQTRTVGLATTTTHSRGNQINNDNQINNTNNKPSSTKQRLDPTARRPNQKCDPYGQGGKPMDSESAAQAHLALQLDNGDWQLEYNDDDDDTPVALVRDFMVNDFLTAARIARVVASTAVLQNHFPSVHMERLIVRKAWQTIVRVRCHTTVLGGLSMHDFQLAVVRKDKPSRIVIMYHSMILTLCGCYVCMEMRISSQMIDLEMKRPEIQKLWKSPNETTD